MQNLNSMSWIKSRYQTLVDMCTEWSANRLSPYDNARYLGGTAYKDILGIVCPPSLEVQAYDSQNMINGVPPGFTFVRSSTATAYDANGILQSYDVNQLRHEWDPVTRKYKGWLIEGQNTNYFTYSEDLSQSVWVKFNCAVSQDSTSFLGPNFTTYRLTEASDSATQKNFRISTVSVASGSVFTVSVYVKPDANRMGYTVCPFYSGNGVVVNFNLETLTATPTAIGTGSGTASISYLGNNIYRLSTTVTLPSDTTLLSVYQYFSNTASSGNALYDGDGVSGVSVSGLQLEPGYLTSSYIKTTGAAATRGSDFLKIPTSSFPYNAIEGTMYVDFSIPALGSDNSRYPLSLDVASASYAMYIRIRDDLTDQTTFYCVNSSTQGYLSSLITTTLINTSYRVAVGYKADDFAGTTNGGTVNTDTSGTIPTVTWLIIGQMGSGSYLNALNGHVKHVIYFPRKLSDTDLQLLTK